MIWAPANIAWFAQRAGWPRRMLVEVTARAMLTSEGNDNWSWPDPPGATFAYTGLWGADTTGWTPAARQGLYGPLAAASDAWWRYQRDDGWDGFVTVRMLPLDGQLGDDLAQAVRNATPIRPLGTSPEVMVWWRTLESARDALMRTLTEIPPGARPAL